MTTMSSLVLRSQKKQVDRMPFKRFSVKAGKARLLFSSSTYWDGTIVKRIRPFVLSSPELIPLRYTIFKEKTQSWGSDDFEDMFNTLTKITSLAEYLHDKPENSKGDVHHKKQLLKEVESFEEKLGRMNWMKSSHPFSTEKYRDEIHKTRE